MNKAAKLFPQVDTAIMRLSNWILTVHNRDDNASKGEHTYSFCALTEDISEEERAAS